MEVGHGGDEVGPGGIEGVVRENLIVDEEEADAGLGVEGEDISGKLGINEGLVCGEGAKTWLRTMMKTQRWVPMRVRRMVSIYFLMCRWSRRSGPHPLHS